MRYLVLASDYDGTLATAGRLEAATVAALDRCRASGRRVMLVTGRELDDLARVCPTLDRFDRIVAENGALLYDPGTGRERLLADPAPEALVRTLRERGVAPLSVGRVIIATEEPHEAAVLRAIRDLGLEYEVIFNKGAVMVLPSGVNKATGMAAALDELGLTRHDVVAVGDAENDHAFLAAAECAVAVANALPSLQERADLVTARDHGGGVVELIDRLLADDLRSLDGALARHDLVLGDRADGTAVRLSARRQAVLIAGPSRAGKSPLAMALTEGAIAAGYQVCVIDPEGDYADAFGAVALGDASHAPGLDETRGLLAGPGSRAVLNLLAVPTEDRPRFAGELWSVVGDLRARTGRPHWVLVDEAHHVLPAGWTGADRAAAALAEGAAFVTVSPATMAVEVLRAISVVVGVGPDGMDSVRAFAAAVGEAAPTAEPVPPSFGTDVRVAVAWHRRVGGIGAAGGVAGGAAASGLEWFRRVQPVTAHRRHVRKYAEGQLPPERSFYFRGPTGALRLQASNLSSFVQLASGVDDGTWEHHLRQGDYARWFRQDIKDEALADAAAEVASDRSLSASESRSRIRAEIDRRYTKPATAPA